MESAEAESEPNLFELRGLRKRLGGREVVCGVDLVVREGEIVGLLGKNGAGKTTTFKMSVGLLRPDGGGVFFRGEEVTDLPMYLRCRLGMGYLPQEASVFAGMTVAENVTAVLEARGFAPPERRERLGRLLEDMGLVEKRSARANILSGGQRRRLEIARALAADPAMLLFDEPFTGVDPIAVFEIQEIVYDLRGRGIGILLTDHNVRETLSITSRAYIMEAGEIWLQGTPEELVNHPAARRLYLGERFEMQRLKLDRRKPGAADGSEEGR